MSNGESPEPNPEVEFIYTRSPFCRTMYIEGIQGGVHPGMRFITANIFSERRSTPTREVFDLRPDGTLAKPPKSFEIHGTLIREIEATLVLDMPTAMALRDWLDRQLISFQQLTDEANKQLQNNPANSTT